MSEWRKGLNFSRAKYKQLDEFTFLPHVRSDSSTSIPRNIVEKFSDIELKNPVALVEIQQKDREFFRIKKLKKQGNSLTISLKPCYETGHKIKIIDIKDERLLLSREKEKTKRKINISSILPHYTNRGIKSTPIYLFKQGKKLVAGGYYKKDLVINGNISLNETSLSAIGLYFCEGGKFNATFTNSWPSAINIILKFLEGNFYIDRKNIHAAIYCNKSLTGKKQNLEEFWTHKTGINLFYEKLHTSINSTSPCGTLELHFSSKILKEILISIIDNLFNYKFDKSHLQRGVLSGDGSPIRQTKYNLTHHIATDKKPESLTFIKNIFSGFTLKVIPTQPKITVYTTWKQNKNLLLNDSYRFNLLNRVRFANRFLNLPKTVSTKDKDLEKFRNTDYNNLLDDLLQHYNDLNQFNLSDESLMEKIKNDHSLC